MLQGGSAVHRGQVAGYMSGEGPGASTAPRHKVKIYNNYTQQELEVEVPEDRWVVSVCAAHAPVWGRAALWSFCRRCASCRLVSALAAGAGSLWQHRLLVDICTWLPDRHVLFHARPTHLFSCLVTLASSSTGMSPRRTTPAQPDPQGRPCGPQVHSVCR